MSGKFKYHAGLHSVGNYQASARPYVRSGLTAPISGAASTALEVSFPKVTKFVTVRNDGAVASGSCTLRLAFAQDGMKEMNKNYVIIHESASFSADFRVTRLYLMSDSRAALDGTSADNGTIQATVTAGLTQIDASHLTSSWTGLEGTDTNVRP